MEKVAAELRAAQLQERENLHNQAIRDLEKSFSDTKNELMVTLLLCLYDSNRVNYES